MTNTRPMAKEEGFALRVQLDAMLGALRANDPEAIRQMDADTIELITRLQVARDTALKIEDTHPSLATRRGISLAKPTDPKPGVSLAKVTTLANR